VKQASKYWPRSERVAKAAYLLNTDGDEGIDFEQQQEPITGRKPSVAMPEARKRPDPVGVTDVEPKNEQVKQKPAQQGVCSPGEIAFLNNKLKRKDWNVAYACELAGLDARESFDGIGPDEFIALRDVLK
jgi:hypothetical protein